MPHLRPLLLLALLLPALLPLVVACSRRAAPTPDARDEVAEDATPNTAQGEAPKETAMEPKADPKSDAKDDAYWREKLTPEQYRILRKKGTERAFTGKYWDTTTAGVYGCAGCGEPLFRSDAKFESGCGWPSFFEPLEGARLTETHDASAGMVRTEITCKKCGGHLGHVFNDGPEPTGLRYCINSVSIDLVSDGRAPKSSAPETDDDRNADDK